MSNTFRLIGVFVLLALPSAAAAQTLGDVAKAEEARRKTVKQPSKVYTNDNLRGSGETTSVVPGSATPPASAAAAAPAAKTPDAGKADATKPNQPAANDDPKKDEKYWKSRVSAAQDALTHDKVLADALQSRINALTTDFVNMSDPAQRSVIEQNKKTAAAELDRVQKDMEKQTKAVADIQEEARKANVPSGWLR